MCRRYWRIGFVFYHLCMAREGLIQLVMLDEHLDKHLDEYLGRHCESDRTLRVGLGGTLMA